jgi:purine nucleosidase
MPIPLILDTDVGDDVDDIFAILLAALRPELDLIGVTSVFGDAEERARIARKLLDLAGKPNVPIATGFGATLDGRDPTGGPGATMTSARGFVSGRGSAEWDTLGARLDGRHGVDFMLDLVRSAAEPPVIAAVGPLTNIAEALRREPDLGQRIRALVIMGGRLRDDTARGEHNFNCDPTATRIVLESGAPLAIGTFEVTEHARIGEPHLARLRAGDGASRAAADQLELYLGVRKRAVTSMFDPISLTLAYTDAYLTTRHVALRVTQPAEKPVLQVEEGATPNARVSTALDAEGFVEHLLTSIGV